MHDDLTILMARQPVQIVSSDEGLATELRRRCRGFVIHDRAPWLTLEVGLSLESERNVRGASVTALGHERWRIDTKRASGLLWRDGHWHATGEVADLVSVNQLLNLCLSLLFPLSGVLMLHADTVELDGEAHAFLGPSGAGKTTLAGRVVELAGAQTLAVDRTMVSVADDTSDPKVVSMPRLVPSIGGSSIGEPLEVPLGSLVFPKGSEGGSPRLRRLPPLEAHQQLLRSVIIPQGDGQPVDSAFALVECLLSRVEASELSWMLDDDVVELLRARGGSSI